MMHVPNQYRVRNHPLLATSDEDGNNGAFVIRRSNGRDLWIIASDASMWEEVGFTGPKWEHVSVHVNDGKNNFIPRWTEMCYVKDLFWDEEDVVIQFHPKKSEYVNQHAFTLHLWKLVDGEIPTPPKETVGMDLNQYTERIYAKDSSGR